MKKFFTLCLVTLFCCVTGAWAQGTGTQEDPWIANVGEELQLNIPMMGMGYAEFTPEVDGTLTLTRTGGFVTMSGVSLQAKGGGEVIQGVWDFVTTSYKFTPVLEGGTTYVVTFNCSSVMDACTNTFRFDYEEYTVDPNAFRIISATPEAGSKLDKVVYTKPITVTVNRTQEQIGRMEGGFTNNSQNVEVKFVSEDVDAGTSTWTVGPVDMSDVWPDYVSEWTLYEGTTYTLTLEIYEEGQSSQGGTPTETCSITYEGATEATKYSDAKIISVTPSPMAEDPETEEMLSTENPIMTVMFSGNVKVTDCCIALGQFGTIPLDGWTFKYDEATDQTTLTIDVSGGITTEDYNIGINITVEDAETGYPLNDEMPSVPNVTFANSIYSVSMSVADGRVVNYDLVATQLNPLDNGYVTALDKVTFAMDGGQDPDGYYRRTSKADAGIYNENGEKIYDVMLTQDDEKGEAEFEPGAGAVQGESQYMPGTTRHFIATVCELGTVNYDDLSTAKPVEITTPGKYTLKIAKQSIGDGNFDETQPFMPSLYGEGTCNPDYAWTFNVVDHIVTVESVTPEPYGVTGEFNEELPAEVTITFSEEGVRVSNIICQYGSPIPTRDIISESNIEGKTLTFSLPAAALAERNATITIMAAAANGQPINYGYTDQDIADGLSGIMLAYQMPMDIIVPETVTPAETDKVEVLDEITLAFDQPVAYTNTETVLELKNAEGETVTTVTLDVSSETEILLILDNVIEEPGEYTLTIPEKTIYDIDGVNYNSELTLKFNVGTSVGISGIKVNADGTVKVYTIDGIYVGEGNAADMLGKLAKGVYIVNGTKVVVK